jgi:RNA recognition motif-containing protein
MFVTSETGQSREFAFIRFKDSEVAKTVLSRSRSHTILDRRVDIRLSKGKVSCGSTVI